MVSNVVEKAYGDLRLRCLEAFGEEKISLLDKAFEIANKAHAAQKRLSGVPYILHPIAVAEILLEIRLDPTTIITALLHDTLEDTEVTFDQLKKEFGRDVANLVDGVTKLTKIEYQTVQVKQAENFRKLLLAISQDIRVLIVKLADRLHNMRTLHYISSIDKRLRIAHETMEIYALLAERIGIYKFKNELQDLAFSILHPEIKKSIENRLTFLRQKGEPLVKTIQNELTELISSHGIEHEIQGREKTCCSIWHKMEHKNVTFEQLADIMAFRVVTETVEDCYAVLGYIHIKYHTVLGRFKDFISTPKINGYQSLHTVVMGPDQHCIEIQIRTKQMHKVAELGVAAHWAYKQNVDTKKTPGREYRWIRELLHIMENASSPEEFLENTKLEMYYDQVFCFTPKGELVALPKNSTPVDFAFAVHSRVGLSCIGAKINGLISPLKTVLQNGDQVEIICSKTPMPSPTWEKFVATGKAKAAIRKFIRLKQRDEYISLGQALLMKGFKQINKSFDTEFIQQNLNKLKADKLDDVFASVGEGVLETYEVMKILYPGEQYKKKVKNPFSFFKFRKKKEKPENKLPLKGLIPGMAVHFASCCNPLPGDKIVGIVNAGRGVSIHTMDCASLEGYALQPERWIDISWEGTGDEYYNGRIKATILNETGCLASVTSSIAGLGSNISDFKIVGRSIDFFEILIDLEVKGVGHLGNIISGLRTLPCVHGADRNKDTGNVQPQDG